MAPARARAPAAAARAAPAAPTSDSHAAISETQRRKGEPESPVRAHCCSGGPLRHGHGGCGSCSGRYVPACTVCAMQTVSLFTESLSPAWKPDFRRWRQRMRQRRHNGAKHRR